MQIRNIEPELPKRIYLESKSLYFDTATNNKIAVGAADYSGKLRDMAVVFKDSGEYVEIITIHPLKPGQKENRLATGRWIVK